MRLDQSGQRGAIALQRPLEAEPLADRHDGHAVPAEVAAEEDRIAGRDAARAKSRRPAGTQPMPAVLMKMPSPLPRSTTLVSPVTIRTPASRAASAIEATTRRSVSIGSPSSRMKPALRYSRLRPGHRQVVDRAVDGQLADVAAGEEQRTDDEGVGGEGQPSAGHVQHGAVVRRVFRRVGAEAGRNSSSISRRISRPPPPWAICTVACVSSGIGQLSVKSREGSAAMVVPGEVSRQGYGDDNLEGRGAESSQARHPAVRHVRCRASLPQ